MWRSLSVVLVVKHSPVTCIIKLKSSIKLTSNFQSHLQERSSPPLHPSQLHEYHIHDNRWLKNSYCRSSPTFCTLTSPVFHLSSHSHSLHLFPHSLHSHPPTLLPDLLTPLSSSSPACSSSQASNGPSSGYAYSLPSTPVVSHRELRVAQGEGGGSVNARSMKSIPRRPSLFKVSCHQLPVSHTF